MNRVARRAGQVAASSVTNRLINWLLFGVMIALVPFYLKYQIGSSRGDHQILDKLISEGELLGVSVVMNAAALGELMSKDIPSHFRLARTVTTAVSLILICLNSAFFGQTGIAPVIYNQLSWGLLFSTVITSASCVALSAAESN
jgi:hypothetical protein